MLLKVDKDSHTAASYKPTSSLSVVNKVFDRTIQQETTVDSSITHTA